MAPLVPHVDLACGGASMIARPAQVLSAGPWPGTPKFNHRAIAGRTSNAVIVPGTSGAGRVAVMPPAGRPQLLDAARGEQPAVTRPLAARLGQRGDRWGTAAETGGLRHSGICLAGNCDRNLPSPLQARRRARGGPSPDGAVPARPRRRLPGRIRMSAPSRPPPRGPRSAPGSAYDAPCARSWHALPRVARRVTRETPPTGDHRDEGGDPRTRPPQGGGHTLCWWRAPSRRAARCWCPGADVLCRSPAGGLSARAGTPGTAGVPG
jgi:hypothetical protein